tara:strand:- start:89 stop:376 length:288 start_codon:yes stop_codon:yes gene_type:complete
MVSMPRTATIVVESLIMKGIHYNCALGLCKTNLPRWERQGSSLPLFQAFSPHYQRNPMRYLHLGRLFHGGNTARATGKVIAGLKDAADQELDGPE